MEQIERYEAWQHTAFTCSVLANINRDPKQKSNPYTVEDFIPVKSPYQKETAGQKQSWQEIKATMKSFANAMNKGR